MNLRFFTGEVEAYIKSLENFYELSGITLATKSDGKVSLLTSYPTAWMHHYVKQGYDQIDPIHEVGFNCEENPIYWGGDSFIERLNEQQRCLFEEANHHNIQSGISFPLNSPYDRQLLSLAFPHSERITQAISIHLLNEIKSHLQMLGTMLRIETLNNGILLQSDFIAYASKHTKLSIELQQFTHEINDLLMSLHSFFDQLPTHFRYEGKRLLQTLQLRNPHQGLSPSGTEKSLQTPES